MVRQKKSTTQHKKSSFQKGSMAKTIAKAGAGVAAAAGVVAAGAALADKDTRQRLQKGAQKAMSRISDTAENVADRAQSGYENVYKQVGAVGGKSSKKTKKSTKG